MPRLQEVACLDAVLVAAVVALLSLLPRRPSPFAQCHTHAPILVGTHHKTGTVLLQHIFKEACAILMWRCSFNHRPLPCSSPEEAVANGLQLCFLQHGVRFKLSGGSSYRFVHAIRDPMEVVLSGYDYHLHTTERWANVRYKGRWNGTTYVRYLNALPLSEGLQAELTHSLRDSLKTMPRLLNRTGDNPCTSPSPRGLRARLGAPPPARAPASAAPPSHLTRATRRGRTPPWHGSGTCSA